MKSNEMRGLSDAALQEKLKELHVESFKLRFQHATSQLENTARIRQVRKDIARAMMILNQRNATKEAR